MIEIETTTSDHVQELSENLREADVCEIAKFGVTAKKALYRSWRMSLRTKSVMIDGKIGAIYGLGGVVLGDIGRPWLLTSPLVEKHYLNLCLLYRQEARKMLEMFPVLENYVDAQYERAVRLLEIVGFKLYDAETIGRGLFRKFRLEATDGY